MGGLKYSSKELGLAKKMLLVQQGCGGINLKSKCLRIICCVMDARLQINESLNKVLKMH